MKDSGKRQDFLTGSVRDTNEGKPRYDLLSPISLYRLAMWTGKGIEKYGERNWEKGQPLARFIESLERHLQKMKVGLEDEDHEAAVMWNIMGYIHTKYLIKIGELPKELDDFPKYSEEIKKLLIGEENKEVNVDLEASLKVKEEAQKIYENKCKFKVGDKVKVVRRGAIGWENKDWSYELKEGKEYIITEINGYNDIKVNGSNFIIHQDHFEKA